jgi:signal transduction histidine kinase
LTVDKPIRFDLGVDEHLPLKLIGDKNHIKQICSKLLSNAFRFTSKGTIKFKVACRKEGGNVWLIIKISDAGVGIPKEELDILLSDYGQINVAHKLSTGGTTGLGLYIIKRIVEMMKGTLTAASEVGKGSVFTLCIPQRLVSDETIGAEVAKQLKNFQYTENPNDQAIAS